MFYQNSKTDQKKQGRLSYQNKNLTIEQIEEITEQYKYSRTIETINFGRNELTGKKLKAIFLLIEINTSIKKLILSKNKINDDDIKILCSEKIHLFLSIYLQINLIRTFD